MLGQVDNQIKQAACRKNRFARVINLKWRFLIEIGMVGIDLQLRITALSPL
jgi:hypothetical protein